MTRLSADAGRMDGVEARVVLMEVDADESVGIGVHWD